MAHRRAFLAAAASAGGLGLAAGASGATPQAAGGARRDLIELRQYHVNQAQRAGLEAFLKDALIPALNRIGIGPVGVFVAAEGEGPVHVLLRHPSAESAVTTTARLLADAEFTKAGAAFLNAPAKEPAFDRVESGLYLAFTGMPELEVPAKGPDRVYQLRIYESPSVPTGQKKIEMFNEAGEIAIFRRVGLNPVFFGEAIAGPRMPNLTYMLGFESQAALDAGWKAFGADPDWQRLKTMAEYADAAILSKITNIVLKPLPASQI